MDYSGEAVTRDSDFVQDRRPGRNGVGSAFSGVPVGGTGKRVFDAVFALFLIVAFAPLLVLVGVAVKLGSPGPALFGHTRIGFNGKPFKCWKFRTMVKNGDAVLQAHLLKNGDAKREWAATRKLRRDPRVTALGEVLRKYSVDELPQLFNVLLGQMSFVGPRPVVRDELRRYGGGATAYLATRPGITGLWQTSGRSDTSYEDRVALDNRYATQWTAGLDMRILLKTVPVVLGARGSC